MINTQFIKQIAMMLQLTIPFHMISIEHGIMVFFSDTETCATNKYYANSYVIGYIDTYIH
jgi:hypothetical protein